MEEDRREKEEFGACDSKDNKVRDTSVAGLTRLRLCKLPDD